MSAPFFEKPQWLDNLHAYLRARPVRRAMTWGVTCFMLFQFAHLWWGEAITIPRLVVDLIAWGMATVLFYHGMRWWEANHAR